MRKIRILILFVFSISASAQNVGEINADLNLSDSTFYDIEIRIYQGGGITNYSSLFRMYKDKTRKWTAEFYDHYARVDGTTELTTKKRMLKSESDMEFVFQNFVRSHILDLPSLNEIQWKLLTRGKIEKVKRIHRGKEIEEYELGNKKVIITDGEGFKVQIKVGKRTNKFGFSNPDGYLMHYPEVDELIYMCEILNIVRSEFGILGKISRCRVLNDQLLIKIKSCIKDKVLKFKYPSFH